MFGKKPQPQPESAHLVVEVTKADAKKPSQPEIRAHKFVLTDKDGRTRAQLQCAGKGAVALTFHDADEKMGMLLGLDPHQSPTIAMFKDGKVRAGVELDKTTSQPQISLRGAGEGKVEVGYDGKDNASVGLHDANGKLRVSISLDSKGDAEVRIFDKNGYITSQLKPG
jgi:hypothetical protein